MKKYLLLGLMNFAVLLANAQVKAGAQDTTIHIKVDRQAEFPGGMDAFSKFIIAHLPPMQTGDATFKGPLNVAFVVEKDGTLTDIKVLLGFTTDINKGFVAAIKQAPKWQPAKLSNQTVRQQYLATMNFESGVSQPGSPGFMAIEKMAEFPGGTDKFYNYLGDNLKYPAKAKADSVQGKVKVSFVIDTDGALTDIKIEQSLSPETDEEVLRLLKGSRRWSPAIQNSKTVKQKFTITIPFKL